MGGLWIGLPVAVGLGSPALAMQEALTPMRRCALSDMVVAAEVTDIETLWAPGADGGLERHAHLNISTVFRGAGKAGTTVVLPGGQQGEFRHWVEDVPELEVDASYLLFLGHHDGRLVVIGGEAGAVRLASPDRLSSGVSLGQVSKALGGCDVAQ